MKPNPNLPTSRAVAVRTPHLTVPGMAVEDLSLAPDGAMVAVLTGVDSTGASSVLFLDTVTGAERGVVPVGAAEVAVLAAEWTALACLDGRTGEITVRRPVTGDVVGRLNPHQHRGVHAVAIADRGDLAASIGEDGGVALWRPADGGMLAAFAPTSEVDVESCALTFSPTGHVVAVRTDPDTLELWTTDPPHFLGHLPETGPPVFSADGRWVAAAGAAIRLYNLDTGTAPETFPGRGPLAFTPDGTLLVAAAPDGSTAVWRTEPPQPHAHLRGGGPRLSPDGQMLAVTDAGSELSLADLTGQLTARLTGVRGEVHALAIGPGGAVVAAASSDAALRVWRAGTA